MDKANKGVLIHTSFNASAAESMSSSAKTFNCSKTCNFTNEGEIQLGAYIWKDFPYKVMRQIKLFITF